MTFDTGNNPPFDYHGLYRAAHQLEKEGWRSMRTMADSFGRYCVIMEQRDPPHACIAVVAKPSKVWRGTLSTQKKLLLCLARLERPLVIHIENHGFYVFNPLDLFLNGEEPNVRFREEMWNFRIDLGCFWNGDADSFEGVLSWFMRKQLEAEGHFQALQKFAETNKQ